MTLYYILLNFYCLFLEFTKIICDWIKDRYNDLEMLVLNDSFVQVVKYDFFDKEKVDLVNNTNVFQVLYLFILKIFGWNINDYVSLDKLKAPMFCNKENWGGIYEVVYYKDRQETRFYTKSNKFNKEELLSQMTKKTHKQYLFATISDHCDVTSFINEHLSSFNEINQITFDDFYSIIALNKHNVPLKNLDSYLKLIDDDTIEETIYFGSDVIILT